MDTSTQTITTMGIISNEVYNTTPGKNYFSSFPSSPMGMPTAVNLHNQNYNKNYNKKIH